MPQDKEHWQELIQGYLSADLEEVELIELEALIREDPEFVQELEVAKFLHLKEKQAISTSFEKEHVSREGNLPWKWISAGVAAAIALLFLFNSPAGSDAVDAYVSDRIAQEHPGPIVQLAEEEASLWAEAIELYQRNNYAGFVDLLEAETDRERWSGEMSFYYALSLLRSGEHDAAAQAFSGLLLEPTVYTEEAQWFLILAQLKSGKSEEAVNALQHIGSEHFRAEEARELLKLLEAT